ADFLAMSAIDDDGTPLGQPAAPMIDLLGRATDRTNDDCIVGFESWAPPNVDNDRSQLCPEPDIKGLWRNRKTVFSIHDCALLALRVAQNLDRRPSDGASALPRGSYIYYVGRPPASPDDQSWLGFFKAVLNSEPAKLALRSRNHAIIVEINDAVRLGPHTNFSRNRRWQGVLEIKLAVEIAFYFRTADADFQILPLPAWGRGVADPLNARALAFLVFEQNEIIFERICPHQQVVAIRLQIEQNAGTLIDASGDRLEPKADLAAPKIIDPLCNGVGEVGLALHIIEEFGVALAIAGPRFVRHVGGGLTLLPAPAVDNEELVVALRADRPEPDDRQKALGFGPDGFVREGEQQAAFGRTGGLCLR